MAQGLRIRLPMHQTRVRTLVWEDPTCRGATKPVRHNSCAWALEPAATTAEARAPRARAPQREATAMRSLPTAKESGPHSPQLEKACVQQHRPNAAKNKNKINN